VTSFGTEERNAPKRIPAGNEVYEYIIFRGSDIKDLHVKPIPPKDVVVDDPAIVSVSIMAWCIFVVMVAYQNICMEFEFQVVNKTHKLSTK